MKGKVKEELKKKLRVSHFPQIPCTPFQVYVDTLQEAKKVFDILAMYDLFQLKHRIKPDYSNATTLEVWDEGEQDWVTWCSEDGEDNFDRYCDANKIKFPDLCTKTSMEDIRRATR